MIKKIALILALSMATMANSPISSKDYQKMLHIGMDVDWLKTPQGKMGYFNAKKQGISVPKLYKQRGFSHVRIRVKDDMNPELLNQIDSVVTDVLNAGLIPIIAYQANSFKLNPRSDEELQGVVNWWSQVANRLKGKSYKVAYDIIIEPSKRVKKHNDRLNLLYNQVNKEIRKIDDKRILIFGANKISNPAMLPYLDVPKPHKYAMAEWHFYAAGPRKNNQKKLWTTGTEFEKNIIKNKIAMAQNWSAKTGIPTWVGAWMVTNYNKSHRDRVFSDGAPAGGDYTLKEQAKFAKFVVGELKKSKIPYAINSEAKYFDRKNIRWYKSVEPILDIVLQKY